MNLFRTLLQSLVADIQAMRARAPNAFGPFESNEGFIDGSVNVDWLNLRILADQATKVLADNPGTPDIPISMNSGGETWRMGYGDDPTLTADESSLVDFVARMQAAYTTDRFRILLVNGAIRVVTEFIALSDDADAWRAIYSAVAPLRPEIEKMDESPNVDHSWQGTDKAGNKIAERFGPNHGKMETHIEVSVYIGGDQFDMERKIAETITAMRDATGMVWSDYGNGVL